MTPLTNNIKFSPLSKLTLLSVEECLWKLMLCAGICPQLFPMKTIADISDLARWDAPKVVLDQMCGSMVYFFWISQLYNFNVLHLTFVSRPPYLKWPFSNNHVTKSLVSALDAAGIPKWARRIAITFFFNSPLICEAPIHDWIYMSVLSRRAMKKKSHIACHLPLLGNILERTV
jgi:hypothetical protein